MAATQSSKTHDLLLALRHPLRRQILHTMAGSKPHSPRELADSLDQPLSIVSYHVRVLANHGALKLVKTRKVRGSTQHFYRSTVRAHWVRAVLKSSGLPRRRRRRGKKKP